MSGAKIVELTDSNICKLCENALGRYCCPRCNVLYCSLDCYQSVKHGQCSETFYQECVMEELNISENDENSKAKMMEILKRVHESNGIVAEEDDTSDIDSDDDNNYADIAERLAGVDLDDTDHVWEKLTDDERQEFVAFLRSEDVTKLIPKWEPWWSYSIFKKVTEVNKEKSYLEKCPKMKEDIKEFTSISKKAPADCVQYNLINLLAAYAFTTRYFNGDYYEFPEETVACMASLSLVLKANENFVDFDTAVKSVEQQCTNNEWILIDAENISAMREDLDKILKGPESENRKFYILCALSDIHNLMVTALDDSKTKKTAFSKKFPEPHFPEVSKEPKEKIKVYLKKIEYFLSYAKCCLYV